jgi:hypothetical protein
MSPLNIHPEEVAPAPKKKNNKNLKIFLGIGALIAIPVIGSTLAGNITINDGPIQFGQGVQRAIACDDDIDLTVNADYANAENAAGTFTLGSVELSNILHACGGKKIQVSVYNNVADSPAIPIGSCIIDPYAAAEDSACADGSTPGVLWSSNFDPEETNGTAFTLTVSFGSATTDINSTEVYNVTIQSS